MQEWEKKIEEDLIKARAEKEAKDSYDWTPLIHACDKGHEKVVEELIKQGADVKAKSKKGN